MRLTQISLLAFASKAVYGYLDTSPFFMFSKSELLIPTDQLQSGSKLTSNLISSLSQCPSEFYVLLKQPGVAASDFSTLKSSPHLSRLLDLEPAHAFPSNVIVPEVAGEIDTRSIAQELSDRCGARSISIGASAIASTILFETSPQVVSIDFPAPSQSQPERAQDIVEHDRSLLALIHLLGRRNYTILITTTPEVSAAAANPTDTATQYEMFEYDEALHTDLKRDINPSPLKSTKSNETLIDGPLFERYQFFTPGLFMGLLVSFLLLSILYVAISGVASLQVTYAAFDKENGPAAQQKKAQ